MSMSRKYLRIKNMNDCFFCGASAPPIIKEEGKYRVECENCGASIEDYNLDMVLDLWNYIKQENENNYEHTEEEEIAESASNVQ